MNHVKQILEQFFTRQDQQKVNIDEHESMVCNYPDDYYGDQVCITDQAEQAFKRRNQK